MPTSTRRGLKWEWSGTPTSTSPQHLCFPVQCFREGQPACPHSWRPGSHGRRAKRNPRHIHVRPRGQPGWGWHSRLSGWVWSQEACEPDRGGDRVRGPGVGAHLEPANMGKRAEGGWADVRDGAFSIQHIQHRHPQTGGINWGYTERCINLRFQPDDESQPGWGPQRPMGGSTQGPGGSAAIPPPALQRKGQATWLAPPPSGRGTVDGGS